MILPGGTFLLFNVSLSEFQRLIDFKQLDCRKIPTTPSARFKNFRLFLSGESRAGNSRKFLEGVSGDLSASEGFPQGFITLKTALAALEAALLPRRALISLRPFIISSFFPESFIILRIPAPTLSGVASFWMSSFTTSRPATMLGSPIWETPTRH